MKLLLISFLPFFCGDFFVVANEQDERYKHLVGGKVVVPLSGREIPVIADDYVDMEFGTGALKITPGKSHRYYGCCSDRLRGLCHTAAAAGVAACRPSA